MPENEVGLVEAVRLFQEENWAAVVAWCETTLRQNPRHTDALELLGRVALRRRDHLGALARFDQALAIAPKAAGLHLNRGVALAGLRGREQQALRAFRDAARLDPHLAEAHHQAGNMEKRLQRYADAAASLTEAARLAPENATIWLNLGVAQLEAGKYLDAIEVFHRAVQLAPALPEAHNVLGAALLDHGEVTAALAAFSEALKLRSNYAAAHNNRARALKMQGRLPEAIKAYRAALAAAPDPATHSNLVYALNFVGGLEPEQVWAEHQRWATEYATQFAPSVALLRRAEGPERRLRVGFVSPDFVNHAVAYFFEPLLRHRDREEWEVYCYSDAAVPDRVTQRFRSLADHWRDVAGLADEALAALIRQDGIDVLFDLSGHTAHHRLLVFARKPAPVQVTWLGYPNTTGLPTIDYRLTDDLADPPGVTDRWHSESLVRLPRSFLCYQPPVESPEPDLDLDASRRVTFGSLSNFAKLSDACVRVWSELLGRLPEARLVLKSRGLADPGTAAWARQRFASHGIAPERIELNGTLTSVKEHLRLYHRIDVALDPFPYNGTTTTCEALWMGVPVIALLGETHVARVSASLLTQVGHPEWVARNEADYIARAATLAADRATLLHIRGQLRGEMRTSSLCDGPGFARTMTTEVRSLWRKAVGETGLS